jgi:hypothetical protein
MVGMVADAKAIAHELGDPSTRPEGRPISRGFGSVQNRVDQRTALPRVQLGRSPGREACLEAQRAPAAMRARSERGTWLKAVCVAHEIGCG